MIGCEENEDPSIDRGQESLDNETQLKIRVSAALLILIVEFEGLALRVNAQNPSKNLMLLDNVVVLKLDSKFGIQLILQIGG